MESTTIKNIINNDVFVNQDSLVNELLSKEIFQYDDIRVTMENDTEVMQWFAVSEWLADKLDELNAVTLRNDYGNWWGRTEFGQSLEMDADLNAVVKLLEKEEI